MAPKGTKLPTGLAASDSGPGETRMTGNQAASNTPRLVVVLTACITFLALRWIPVAGLGEYGMMYDQAYRLSIGQRWYRDLLSTHPPLTAHVLALLFRFFPPTMLLYNVHLYAWWAGTLLVGWLILRRCVNHFIIRCLAITACAALSLPSLSSGHAYFYAASVLAGVFFLCLDTGLSDHRPGLIFAAGLLAGLTLFVRQNLCLALIAGASSVCVLLWIRRSINSRNTLAKIVLLAVGFCLSSVTTFLIFSRSAGATQVFHQLLIDRAQGKAGEYGLLVRLIPRLNFKYTLSFRRYAEILGSLLIYAVTFWFVAKKPRQTKHYNTRAAESWPFTVVTGRWF